MYKNINLVATDEKGNEPRIRLIELTSKLPEETQKKLFELAALEVEKFHYFSTSRAATERSSRTRKEARSGAKPVSIVGARF
jgi:hypothetical protein